MSRTSTVITAAFLVLGVVGSPAWAQEEDDPKTVSPKAEQKPAQPDAKPEAKAERSAARNTTNLRIQLVISRYTDDKKTGSLPYTFTIVPGAGRVRVRMGVETPVLTGGAANPSSYSYKSVGTNLDCWARELNGHFYEISFTVEHSSAILGEKEASGVAKAGLPLFRKFETSFSPVLRDGQTQQVVASTDPVTGEVVKIDITLNVLK